MSASNSNTYTDINPWEIKPFALFSDLEMIKADYDKTKTLSKAQIKLCHTTFKSLTDFIDPFLRASTHPLLQNIRFHDAMEDLHSAFPDEVSPLWFDSVFQGCGILACLNLASEESETDSHEDEMDERAPTSPTSPTTPITTLHFTQFDDKEVIPLKEDITDYLEESNADEVVRLVEYYSRKSEFLPEKCKAIIHAIQEFLTPFHKVVECSLFKEQKFYEVVYPLIDLAESNSEELISKVLRICKVTINATQSARSSRSNTPVRLGKSADGKSLPYSSSELVRGVQRSLKFGPDHLSTLEKQSTNLDDTAEILEEGDPILEQEEIERASTTGESIITTDFVTSQNLSLQDSHIIKSGELGPTKPATPSIAVIVDQSYQSSQNSRVHEKTPLRGRNKKDQVHIPIEPSQPAGECSCSIL